MSTFVERWTRVIKNVKRDTSRMLWRRKHWQHRDMTYRVVGEAEVFCDAPITNRELIIVCETEDGHLEVRLHSEFMEHFEPAGRLKR